ncbi:MAG: DNA mismatch repair protein MutS, partial [Verrucomicrobiota bacterium]
ATHYHEITQLEKSLPRLRNYSVRVAEWDDQIRFLHTVAPGAADRSYGIQVARLAGLPAEVIGRARDILEELESEGAIVSQHLNPKATEPQPPLRPRKKPPPDDHQLGLF